MKSITKIVITGGPCGGKSTAMTWIESNLSKRGYKVVFIPETASELILGGVAPWTVSSNYEFQKALVSLQIQKERVFEMAARNMADEKILIVADRGILDNKAYMTDEEFQSLCRELGGSEVSFRDNYDAVFHLVTAAQGATKFYTLANNQARTETPEQAIEMDQKLISCWTGHPYLRVIDNSTDFNTKMKRLVNEITQFLGEPDPYEIESKFLIRMPDLEQLEHMPNCKKVEIIQTYLISNDDNVELRIRQRGRDGSYIYIKTAKTTVANGKRIETEQRITKDEYLSLLMNADTSVRQIRKNRYCLTENNLYFEIDVYPFWKHQAILEVQLNTPEQRVTFPSYLTILREVTHDSAYKNHSLARSIPPEETD
ncbi:AAA family ATPase [Butyricicoccus sp.]|uniref:AAA family ATPase n=1 Tax=Butyricicoccus sp. TaxID=2049021 RepID=UPI003F1673E6